MRSGEAMPILIWANGSGLTIGFAKLVSSFMGARPSSNSCSLPPCGGGRREGGRRLCRRRAIGAHPHPIPLPTRGRGELSFRRQLRRSVLVILVDDRVQLDVEAQRAHLLDEHVEALGDAGLERVVAL